MQKLKSIPDGDGTLLDHLMMSMAQVSATATATRITICRCSSQAGAWALRPGFSYRRADAEER